jgi:hypothetical protein
MGNRLPLGRQSSCSLRLHHPAAEIKNRESQADEHDRAKRDEKHALLPLRCSRSVIGLAGSDFFGIDRWVAGLGVLRRESFHR